MRSRLVVTLWLLILLLTGSLTGTGATYAQDLAASCVAAEALEIAGDTDEARAVYVELLKQYPDLECARTGFERVSSPTRAEAIIDSAEPMTEFAGGLNTLFIEVAKPIVALGILVLTFVLWRHLRAPKLLFTVSNASGHDDMEKTLPGLNQLARETLIREMDGVRNKVEKSIPEGPDYQPPPNAVLPREASSQSLDDLRNSLKDAVPGPYSSFLSLINVVPFIERGTKVTGTLQLRGDTPGLLGITFEISDLSGGDPQPYTVWNSPLRDGMKGAQTIRAPTGGTEIDSSRSEEPHFPIAPVRNGAGFLRDAIGFLAEVVQKKPPEVNEEAVALYRLGGIYEERGALEQAKVKYEEALNKQPGFEDAVKALTRVLEGRRTLGERYSELLVPATRWLALELSRRDMIAHSPRLLIGDARRCYKAKVFNFFGVLYEASALSFEPAYLFFYDLAFEEFEQAQRLWPEWYQPFENHADTLSWRGRVAEGDEAVRWQRQAILKYGEALEKTENMPYKAEWRIKVGKIRTWLPIGSSTRHDEAIDRTRDKVQRRIKVGKAMSMLLAGDSILYDEALQVIRNVEADWDALAEMDDRFLYYLASWYAIAYRVNVGDTADSLRKARRYLAYSMARSGKIWDNYAGRDPDFEHILKDGWEKLKFELARSDPELRECRGERFQETLNKILKRAKWL